MIGFIALAGIIVRNSILLVDFVRHRARSGVTLWTLLLEAGAIRCKPILLTALSAMIGAIGAEISFEIFGRHEKHVLHVTQSGAKTPQCFQNARCTGQSFCSASRNSSRLAGVVRTRMTCP
jgi:hypothetical protein